MPPPDHGRPNKAADKLKLNARGLVRPYMLVRLETLQWLEQRGTDARQRTAFLVELLRDRYERQRGAHAPLDLLEEGEHPFRPLLPKSLLEALDAERGDTSSRGQMVDAVVALAIEER